MVTRVMSVKEFANFTKKFPTNLEKMGMDLPTLLAKSMQKGVRIRATGRLKQTEVINKGKNSIQLKYPTMEIGKIANYVNKGAYPKHPIPRKLMEASNAGVETAGRKSRDVLGELTFQEIEQYGGWVQPRPSKTKGFLDNAYNSLVKRIPKLIEKNMQKVFNAS